MGRAIQKRSDDYGTSCAMSIQYSQRMLMVTGSAKAPVPSSTTNCQCLRDTSIFFK
jgi:hypothetical protein